MHDTGSLPLLPGRAPPGAHPWPPPATVPTWQGSESQRLGSWAPFAPCSRFHGLESTRRS